MKGHVYISGALTIVRKGANIKAVYDALGEMCEKAGYTAYIPYHYSDPVQEAELSARVVWEKDKGEVERADIVIAYVGMPSLGVGAELELARIAGKRIILWWFTGEKVSRMVRGNPAVSDMIEATDVQDLETKLTALL